MSLKATHYTENNTQWHNQRKHNKSHFIIFIDKCSRYFSANYLPKNSISASSHLVLAGRTLTPSYLALLVLLLTIPYPIMYFDLSYLLTLVLWLWGIMATENSVKEVPSDREFKNELIAAGAKLVVVDFFAAEWALIRVSITSISSSIATSLAVVLASR